MMRLVSLAIALHTLAACSSTPPPLPVPTKLAADTDVFLAVDEKDSAWLRIDMGRMRELGLMPLARGYFERGEVDTCAFDPWTDVERLAVSAGGDGVVGALRTSLVIDDHACAIGRIAGWIGADVDKSSVDTLGEIVVFGSSGRLDDAKRRLAHGSHNLGDAFLVSRQAIERDGVDEVRIALSGEVRMLVDVIPIRDDANNAAEIGLLIKERIAALPFEAPRIDLGARGIVIDLRQTMSEELRSWIAENGDAIFR